MPRLCPISSISRSQEPLLCLPCTQDCKLQPVAACAFVLFFIDSLSFISQDMISELDVTIDIPALIVADGVASPNTAVESRSTSTTPQPGTTENIVDYGPPFADEDSDIILRSSDNVDFHVHRLFLSKASPVFRDMFSLPQGMDTPLTGAPIVQMSEGQQSLDTMLRFCYPIPDPPLTSIGAIKQALKVGQKFQIAQIESAVQERAISNVRTFDPPETLYALGWRYQLRDVVLAAAKETLRSVNSPTYVDDFDELAGIAYHRLVDYRARCGEVASSAIRSWKLWEQPPPPAILPCCTSATSILVYGTGNRIEIQTWVKDFLERVAATLRSQPWPSSVWNIATLASSLEAASCKMCLVDRSLSMAGVEQFLFRLDQLIEDEIDAVRTRSLRMLDMSIRY